MVNRYNIAHGNIHRDWPPGRMDMVLASDYDALAAELADWKRMRNEAMAVAVSNRTRIDELTAELAEAKLQRDSWKRIAESGLGLTEGRDEKHDRNTLNRDWKRMRNEAMAVAVREPSPAPELRGRSRVAQIMDELKSGRIIK